MNVTQRFLRYVGYDTTSDPKSKTCPSTPGQLELGRVLVEEMRELGITDARMDRHGYVYGSIPANNGKDGPVLGLIAHMDTSPDMPGGGIKPRIVEDYDGGDVVLNAGKHIVLSPAMFPVLRRYVGQDLIVTDGTTLLGADNKAGVAEILSMAAFFLTHPEVSHGALRIGFTPDEEIGRGADRFDVEGFGADFAYTVDGGAIGQLSYENFNAASAKVVVNGVNIHPGTAKNRMKNACLIAMELAALLPGAQRPEHTEGREGFYHINGMAGTVERATLDIIVRDHDDGLYEEKLEHLRRCAGLLNAKYGQDTVELAITESYRNMAAMVAPQMHIIHTAVAAMEKLGVEPDIIPTRGGTDGSRLSFMGLPCPNLCAGLSNGHSRYEFVPVQSLERITEILIEIVKAYA